jgi:hypothetical protein
VGCAATCRIRDDLVTGRARRARVTNIG